MVHAPEMTAAFKLSQTLSVWKRSQALGMSDQNTMTNFASGLPFSST